MRADWWLMYIIILGTLGLMTKSTESLITRKLKLSWDKVHLLFYKLSSWYEICIYYLYLSLPYPECYYYIQNANFGCEFAEDAIKLKVKVRPLNG